MWYLTLLFILLSVLVSCGLQKPSAVLFRGEDFYGNRDLENTREYHLIKDGVKEKSKKITVKIYKNTPKTESASHKFLMPIKGKITAKFKSDISDEMCKNGIKISSDNGSDVIASASGKVIYVGKGLRWYGNLIIIEHKNNYVTVYSYLKTIQVEIGDKVRQGQVIGLAGKSSTQDKKPQICFTIRYNGQAVDPTLHMN
ncbi:murein hydrolase activator EnvC family protein [Wolbachia endosymbiont of Chironomus riparius]|uniref:murein hydrolase activator EnvC family protein n=1 Tax=Wolbachia endosymbiont of Chironomus riparius TaxID=2883238 RepID=UPI0020A01F14|nr:M23 family metallopeptidase [Wolbachia endosymbiont of Chironomus riparius]